MIQQHKQQHNFDIRLLLLLLFLLPAPIFLKITFFFSLKNKIRHQFLFFITDISRISIAIIPYCFQSSIDGVPSALPFSAPIHDPAIASLPPLNQRRRFISIDFYIPAAFISATVPFPAPSIFPPPSIPIPPHLTAPPLFRHLTAQSDSNSINIRKLLLFPPPHPPPPPSNASFQ